MGTWGRLFMTSSLIDNEWFRMLLKWSLLTVRESSSNQLNDWKAPSTLSTHAAEDNYHHKFKHSSIIHSTSTKGIARPATTTNIHPSSTLHARSILWMVLLNRLIVHLDQGLLPESHCRFLEECRTVQDGVCSATAAKDMSDQESTSLTAQMNNKMHARLNIQTYFI